MSSLETLGPLDQIGLTTGKIIIGSPLPSDLTKILACLCLHIQNEYDIAPTILNKMINYQPFIKWCLFLYNQIHSELEDNLASFKETFNRDKTRVPDDEYDKCGYLITSHQNSFISYCNSHKYLHPHPSLPDHHGNCPIDHYFVAKNPNQILEEKYKSTIHLIYQQFINKLYQIVLQLFTYILTTTCQQLTLKISEISDLTEQMNHDINLFKSRCIYEHHERKPTGGDTPPHHTSKSYYIKVYRWGTQFPQIPILSTEKCFTTSTDLSDQLVPR